MKIGFDLAQASEPLAGCGWYAHTLLDAMATAAPAHEFLGYRHFGNWFNDSPKLAPLPAHPNVTNPLDGYSMDATVAAWNRALADRRAPGQPDVVHSTSFQSPLLANTKLVVTIFDLSFWAVPEFTTDQIRLDCQAGLLDALEHAHGLVFISEHARREFARFVPHHRRTQAIATTVTPLASRWKALPGTAANPGDYWLFVGSLEPRKNLLNLLTAYENYAQKHPAPKPLWLAGGAGWKNQAIKERIEALKARNLVRLLGYVSDESLPEIYRNAHALIFPSWYEGFGLPVLEAMSQGCPVICSDRTSLPEVGGKAVHYIDPASPDAITSAMLRLENDASYRKLLAVQGLAQAATFSWSQTAKQTLAFYERVASNHPLLS